jgi:hypothetical protein
MVLGFDNLSYLPPWLSDSRCRLATGGGFACRELYTNDEETIFDSKRPMILNGIEDFVSRADLLERSIVIRQPPIPEEDRKPESELWAAFAAAHPRLLGALLDRVSAGLRALPSTRLARLPRMADFALFAIACETGAGETPLFMSAHAANQADATHQALEASPLPAVLVRFMADRDKWTGTATELLAALTELASGSEGKDWPKRANALTGKLRRLAPNLRRVHRLDLDLDGRDSDRLRTRQITITRQAESGRERSSASSASPEPLESTAPAPDDVRTVSDGDRRKDRPHAEPHEIKTFAGDSDDADDADDVSPSLSGLPRSGQPRCRFTSDDTPHGRRA